MNQLRLYERENDEDDECADDQVGVGQITISPESANEGGQFDRPGKKTGEDGDEVEWQKSDVGGGGIRTVAFHRAKRSRDNVLADPDLKKLSVRANERWNSPERDDSEYQRDPGNRCSGGRQPRATTAATETGAGDRQQRRPANRAFGQKRERECDVEVEPPQERNPCSAF